LTQQSIVLPYSIEDFLSDEETAYILDEIDGYKASIAPSLLEAGARGYTIHNFDSASVDHIVKVYEPNGRIDVNWQDIPRGIVDVIETAFFRRIEDIRRAYPTALGPIGYTYVEYGPSQFFTAHLDGATHMQVAGFGVTLSNDFEGGDFAVETCGSGELWRDTSDGRLQNAPGHDAQSAWFRSLKRTRWTTRPTRGTAIFYGSGLTHSSEPVQRGILKKVLAFIQSY
jgi:hypothetical protein